MEANGSSIEQEIRNISRIIPDAQRIQAPSPSSAPFEMKAHDLMHQTIDQVCADWVHQLELVRENSKKIEQLVLEQATKVKADLSQLYELGKAAVAEAARGNEVNQKLMRELEKMLPETKASS